MVTKIRYLVCCAGSYTIAIPSTAVLRIWNRAPADVAPASGTIDLRNALGAESAGEGTAIALEESGNVLVVDEVKGMTMIAESEFFPLPPVFSFANTFFDAACRETIDGRHALRLRLQSLLSGAPARCAPL